MRLPRALAAGWASFFCCTFGVCVIDYWISAGLDSKKSFLTSAVVSAKAAYSQLLHAAVCF